jgi:methyl-accepting chemotaxis protein
MASKGQGMTTPERTPNPERIRWLIPLALLINLLLVGMTVTYSLLNLWPFLPAHGSRTLTLVRFVAFHIASLLPAALSVLSLRPITAWLRRVWRVSRAMDRPLRRLENAMARLRGGDFTARLTVSATDEIGALEEGFNLMAEHLAASYHTLEVQNQELAAALDRVAFLERVKQGLDRFVPDTVRRLIEQDPEAAACGNRRGTSR